MGTTLQLLTLPMKPLPVKAFKASSVCEKLNIFFLLILLQYTSYCRQLQHLFSEVINTKPFIHKAFGCFYVLRFKAK